MRYGLVVATAPVDEPISLGEVKQYQRIDGTDDDAYIEGLITAARNQVETETGRSLITTTWTWTLDRFPSGDVLEVPRSPLRSVSSITYVDTNGTTQTLATTVYDVDTQRDPGRIFLKYQQVWPVVRSIQNSIVVTFSAGYGTANDIPRNLKLGMMILVSHWYENREPIITGTIVADTPLSAGYLIWPYRVKEFA